MTDRNDGEAVAYSGNFADRRLPSGKGRRVADRRENTGAAPQTEGGPSPQEDGEPRETPTGTEDAHLRDAVRERRAAARALIAANDRLGEPTPDAVRKLAAEQDPEDQDAEDQAL